MGSETKQAQFLLLSFSWSGGGHGDAEGHFDACVGIAIGKDDVVYTSEFRNRRIQRFTSDGKFLSSFPVRLAPGGMAIDPNGNVYVGFWNDNLVAAYTPDGTLLQEWGKKGTGDGEFQLPGSIALGPDGLLYVPDQGNSRVQKFTTEGQFVGKWGSESAELGGFGPPPVGKDGTTSQGGPIALCLDVQDRVWVSATNSRVQLFSNGGKYLCGLGGEGSDSGQFERPHGLALDSHGCLYVVDTMNYRIQKFGFI